MEGLIFQNDSVCSLHIEDGKIIASGTHNELLKTCKEYKQLYVSEILKHEQEEQKLIEE